MVKLIYALNKNTKFFLLHTHFGLCFSATFNMFIVYFYLHLFVYLLKKDWFFNNISMCLGSFYVSRGYEIEFIVHFYFMCLTFLHTVIYQVFLSNTNNLHKVVWFQIFIILKMLWVLVIISLKKKNLLINFNHPTYKIFSKSVSCLIKKKKQRKSNKIFLFKTFSLNIFSLIRS